MRRVGLSCFISAIFLATTTTLASAVPCATHKKFCDMKLSAEGKANPNNICVRRANRCKGSPSDSEWMALSN
jgi:hypothetical protein